MHNAYSLLATCFFFNSTKNLLLYWCLHRGSMNLTTNRHKLPHSDPLQGMLSSTMNLNKGEGGLYIVTKLSYPCWHAVEMCYLFLPYILHLSHNIIPNHLLSGKCWWKVVTLIFCRYNNYINTFIAWAPLNPLMHPRIYASPSFSKICGIPHCCMLGQFNYCGYSVLPCTRLTCNLYRSMQWNAGIELSLTIRLAELTAWL